MRSADGLGHRMLDLPSLAFWLLTERMPLVRAGAGPSHAASPEPSRRAERCQAGACLSCLRMGARAELVTAAGNTGRAVRVTTQIAGGKGLASDAGAQFEAYSLAAPWYDNRAKSSRYTGKSCPCYTDTSWQPRSKDDRIPGPGIRMT